VNGNVLDGFPFAPGTDRVFSYSSPVLADLDGDGIREILAGDHSLALGNGAVHALKFDGSVLEGWPKYTAHWIYGPPAVGDIDGDGEPDVAVGDQVLAGSPSNRVYAWDKNGNNLSGWPSPFINAINNQILLADFDGDNMVELMWDDNTSNNVYIGYNHDGTPMDGWPLSLNGSSFFMNPFAADINNDGNLDVSGASGNLSTNALDFYLWNADVPVDPASSPLTILQYNVRHDGVYTDPSALSAAFSASSVYICEGSEVQYSDVSIGNPVSWEWIFEGGEPAMSTEQNPQVTYPVTGIYDVSLTVSDGTTNSSVTWNDFMKVAYAPEVPVIPSGPANFSTDTTTFTIYETSASNADDYTWELTPEDVGVITAGDTSTQVKIYWSNDPDYSAELRVKTENACGESEFSDPLIIYVNWTVGLSSTPFQNPFTIYPNPSDGRIFLHFNEHIQPVRLALYSSFGSQIEINNSRKSDGSYLFDGLPSGIYILSVETEEAHYYEKIIVR
jgi:PKD repeat protein